MFNEDAADNQRYAVGRKILAKLFKKNFDVLSMSVKEKSSNFKFNIRNAVKIVWRYAGKAVEMYGTAAFRHINQRKIVLAIT